MIETDQGHEIINFDDEMSVTTVNVILSTLNVTAN